MVSGGLERSKGRETWLGLRGGPRTRLHRDEVEERSEGPNSGRGRKALGWEGDAGCEPMIVLR